MSPLPDAPIDDPTDAPALAPAAARPAWWPLAGLVAGWTALLFWVFHSHRFSGVDADLFWQLKYGQMILSEHQLFNRDVFSWSAPGGYWLNQEWGGQVTLAALYALGGLRAIETAHWLLFVATLALATRLFKRAGWSFPAAAGGAVALHFLLYGQTVFRLQNFTTACLLITAYVLQTWWLNRRLGPVGWAYPVLVVLWANLHGGGAIAGVASCGIVLGAEAVACLKTKRWRELWPLLYVVAGGGLALLVNPEGYHLPAHSLATLFDPTVKAVNAMVGEWHPFTWSNLNYRLYVGAMAIVALAGLLSRRWPPLGMLAFAAAWGAMAMLSRRNLALAPIAAVPLAAFWIAAARDALTARPAWMRHGASAALAAAGALLVVLSPPFNRLDLSGAPAYPSGAALQATMSLGEHHRMINFYEWGGIIMFLGHPKVKVFIDGRAYHYGPTMMREYNAMMNLAPGWQQAFNRYGADMVVAPPFIGLVHALAEDPGWRVAFADDTAVVVVKRTVPARAK